MNRREQGGSIFREGSDRRRDNRNYETERTYSNQNFGQDEYVTDSSSFRNDDVNLQTSRRGSDGGSGYTESFERNSGRNYNEEGNWRNQNPNNQSRDSRSEYGEDYRYAQPHQVHEPHEERGQQIRQEQIRQQYLQRHQQSQQDRLQERNFSGMGPKGYRRSDQRIEEEVCNILMRDKNINASEIEVHVENGIVQLSGTVSSRSARFDAEMAVDGIPGVEDIQNDLKVRKWIDFEDRREPSRNSKSS